MDIRIYHTDGGCKSNGSEDAWGIAVATDLEGKIIIEQKIIKFGRLEKVTNNVAELEAVRLLLKKLSKNPFPIEIQTDSELTAHLLNREYSTKYGYLASIVLKFLKIIHTDFKDQVTISWIPRDKNIAGIYIENKYSL